MVTQLLTEHMEETDVMWHLNSSPSDRIPTDGCHHLPENCAPLPNLTSTLNSSEKHVWFLHLKQENNRMCCKCERKNILLSTNSKFLRVSLHMWPEEGSHSWPHVLEIMS